MGAVRQFTGLLPQLDPRNLPINAATVSQNIDYSSGRLDLWRKPELVRDLNGEACAGLFCQCEFVPHGHKDDYLINVGCDAIASGPCTVCPMYICGDQKGRALGFPAPMDPPTVAKLTETADGCYTQQRFYFYTLGNDKQEGKPSPLSATFKADKEDCFRVTVPDYVPDDCPYEVTKIRIYRSQVVGLIGHGDGTSTTGFLTPALNPGVVGDPEPPWTWAENSDSECFLVECLTVGGSMTFEDKRDVLELGRANISNEACPPERDLCVVGETVNGSLVGFNETAIWFSERNKHDHWPVRSAVCIEGRKVKDVCVLRNTVVVLTDAEPYLIQDDNDCRGSEGRTVLPLPSKAPACSRCFKTSRGVVFAGPDALILITEQGSITRLTDRLVPKRDWQTYGLECLSLAEYCGTLFIDMPGFSATYLWGNDVTAAVLSHLCLGPIDCWIESESGAELYFLFDGDLYQFDIACDYYEGTWRSSYIAMGYVPVSALSVEYSSAMPGKAVVEPGIVEVFMDGEVAYAGKPNNCEGVRFRACRGKYMEIEISTREPVSAICFGSSLSVLNQVAA